MAMTGRDPEEANALLNRFLREFEGEPGVTEDGTVVYSFPSLMRTARQEPRAEVPLRMPGSRQPIPFSANARKTNGWIVFFNAFNLAFGSWFLGVTLSQGAAAFAQTGPSLTYYLGQLLQGAGISPVPFTAIVLGAVPVAFSVLFFLVPLLRTRWLARKNAMLREAELRRRVMETVLANPARVEESQVPSAGPGLDPRDLPRARRRLLEKVAAALGADPLPAGDGTFAWRFKELERQAADLAAFRRGIDLRKYELGRTVFDTGT
jgi:hypothetical protein